MVYWTIIFAIISIGNAVVLEGEFSNHFFLYPIFLMPSFVLVLLLLALIAMGLWAEVGNWGNSREFVFWTPFFFLTRQGFLQVLFSIQSEGLVWNHRAKSGAWNPSQSDGIASRVSVHLPAAWCNKGVARHSPEVYTTLRVDDMQFLRNWWYTRLRRDYIESYVEVLDFKGLFVFLGVKNNPLSPLHLSLTLWTWTCDFIEMPWKNGNFVI